MIKKVACVLLAFVLCFSTLPAAFAEEIAGDTPQQNQEQGDGSTAFADDTTAGPSPQSEETTPLSSTDEAILEHLSNGVASSDMTAFGDAGEYRSNQIVVQFEAGFEVTTVTDSLIQSLTEADCIEQARARIFELEAEIASDSGATLLSDAEKLAVHSQIEIVSNPTVSVIEGSETTGAIATIAFSDTLSVAQALTVASGIEGVSAVQPDYFYQLMETEQQAPVGGQATNAQNTNDTSTESGDDEQWWLESINALGIHDSEALTTLSDEEESSATVVAVLDTGALLSHPELTEYLDTARAWNATTNQALADSDTEGGDASGHGTQMSGVISAIGQSNVKILPIKVFSQDDSSMAEATAPRSSTSLVLAGMYKILAYNEAAESERIQVINTGFGGSNDDRLLHNAIQTAHNAGILVVAAAGNDATNKLTYPSDYDEVVSVTALNAHDETASYSNHNEHKNISAPGGEVAPGVGILSAYHDGGTSWGAGSSFAASMVSGAAALLLSAQPELSMTELTELLYETADDLGTEGWDEYYGWGKLNLEGALAALTNEQSQSQSQDQVQSQTMSTLATSKKALPSIFVATITSSLNPSMVLDVPNASLNYAVGLQVWSSNMTPAQRFRFVKCGNYYTIYSVSSGLAIDLAGAHVARGSKIQQYRPNGTDAQLWSVESNLGNSVTIRSKLDPNFVWDVSGGIATRGAVLNLWSSNGTGAQRFVLDIHTRTVADGLHTITSRLGQTVMDISNGSRVNGGNLNMWNPNRSLAQKFQLKYDANSGYYTMMAACSGRVLDVAGGIMAPGTNVHQYHWNGSNAQKWIIKEASAGSGIYNIYVAGGYLLEVKNASSAAGANIWINHASGSNAQKFTFTSTETIAPGIYSLESGSASPSSVDVAGASTSEGATLQVWNTNSTIAQMFRFNRVGTNIFTVESLLTGYYMTESGGTISMRRNSGSSNQQWLAHVSPYGGIKLINRSSGLVMDVANRIGPTIHAYRDNGTNAQQFHPKLVSTLLIEGQYSFYTAINGAQVLDIAGGSTSDGALLNSYRYNGSNAQKFWVYPTGDGNFQLLATHSFKALDVSGGLLGQTGKVIQSSRDANKASQKWRFEYAGNGYFMIVSALSSGSHALTLKSLSASNGSGVATASKNSSATQLFRPVLLQRSSGMLVNGIDVSSHQSPSIGWSVDYDFLIVKATGGNYYVNPYFKQQADAALSRGKKLGLYHYAHESGTNSATQEARHFVNNIQPYVGHAVLFLDFEENRSAYYNDKAWVREFCTTVKNLTGVSCQIYASASWAQSKINGVWTELNVWLWEASWPAGDPVFNGYSPTNTYWFSPAQGMRIHQYTSNGRLTGYSNRLDMNAFYGSRDEWTYRQTH